MPRGESFAPSLMHLQQTKRGSIATGGSQHYFHSNRDTSTDGCDPSKETRHEWRHR